MADKYPGAERFLPPRKTIPAMRAAADDCRGCPLWKNATQAVFGAGAARPELVIVGEQPGDQEDLAGMPFVGPAGRLLNDALEKAGIERDKTYVTNAVKHFKFTRAAKGARRIHARPNDSEVRACTPWLDGELRALRPRIILALGATAAKALLGPKIRVTTDRGRVLAIASAEAAFVTLHPSAILRTPSGERAEAERAFVADLKKVKRYMASGAEGR